MFNIKYSNSTTNKKKKVNAIQKIDFYFYFVIHQVSMKVGALKYVIVEHAHFQQVFLSFRV